MTLSFWIDAAVRILAALWAGSIFAFAAWFAPHAFRTLPSRAEAAAFTRPVRERLERFGAYACVLIALLLYYLGIRDGWWTLSRVRMGFALLAAAAWLVHVWGVRPAMERAFSRTLHRWSEVLYAAALVGAVAVVAV